MQVTMFDNEAETTRFAWEGERVVGGGQRMLGGVRGQSSRAGNGSSVRKIDGMVSDGVPFLAQAPVSHDGMLFTERGGGGGSSSSMIRFDMKGSKAHLSHQRTTLTHTERETNQPNEAEVNE